MAVPDVPPPPGAPASLPTDVWLADPAGKPVKVGAADVANLTSLGFTPLDPEVGLRIEAANKHRGLLSTIGVCS